MSGTDASAPAPGLSLGGAALPVRRNTILLAGGMAALYGMVELSSAAATLTFVTVGGARELAGLAPAVFLATAALAALPAGRAMDRFGRVPILAGGFGAGIGGSLLAALGVFSRSLAAVVGGFVLVGVAIGTVMLSRAAAADMYAPDERPRGIAFVLFGAVFGALLGPAVFIPLAAGEVGGSSLGLSWLGAAGFMLVGLSLMGGVRPDPQRIAATLAPEPVAATPASEPLRLIVRRPGVGSALVAAVASWSVMVALMTLAGSALVAHGHDQTAIFPVLSAHFIGMFGLFPLVGRLIARVGQARALAGGLLLIGASSLAAAATAQSVVAFAGALFGVGLGWSLAYVAATTALSARASAAESGRLLGFADLLSGLSGAALTILAGFVLTAGGLPVVALGAAILPTAAALWMLRRAPQPA